MTLSNDRRHRMNAWRSVFAEGCQIGDLAVQSFQAKFCKLGALFFQKSPTHSRSLFSRSGQIGMRVNQNPSVALASAAKRMGSAAVPTVECTLCWATCLFRKTL